ncbi:MAG: hypothetical protein DRP00_05090 [Candidatus Aenigmatarchaeota archaeon]|nr:MAG: hypothetical protein DRP00_05090 [Candidatus Aenigmarchaeota archaeon]
MNKRVLSFLENKSSQLIKKYHLIKAIFIYGSSVKKKRVTTDIDLVVIVDDTSEEFKDSILNWLENDLKIIAEEAYKKLKINLHFQSPKTLSLWWDSLRSGEPWVVNAVKEAWILYDPSDYITPLKSLIKQGRIAGTREKAEALIERAPFRYKEALRIMLEEITEELLSAMTETAQAVLMFFRVAPPAAKDIPKELRKNFVRTGMLKEGVVEYFEYVYEIADKIAHREITKLSGKEIKKLLNRAVLFIDKMDDLFSVLETTKKKNIIEDSYKKAINICKKALKLKEPELNSEVLKKFKKEFVDSGLISQDYLYILKKLGKMKELAEKGKLEEIPERDIYSSMIYTRKLEEILKKRKR